MKHQKQFIPSMILVPILREIIVYHTVNFNDINKVLRYVNQQLKKTGLAPLPGQQARRLRRLINENNMEQDYYDCKQNDPRLKNLQAQTAKALKESFDQKKSWSR